MKNIKFKLVGLLVAIMVLQVSCKKSTFEDANHNPNAPKAVIPSVLLANVEASLAYTQGGDFSRYAGLFDQQLFSDPSFGQQAGAYYVYVITNQDVDNIYGNLFTSVMKNDLSLKELSDSLHYNAYSGISRIIMAYSLQLGVDFWGKIPYSTALQGLPNVHPTYDDDKALYDTIGSLIDVGITQLQNSDADLVSPGGEDVIYGADLPSWIAFGHAIKARIAIHQSKGNITMANTAIAEAALADPSTYNNAVYIFGTTETSANPVYQFNEQRLTIDFPSSSCASYMSDLTDPRYGVYFDSTYNPNGVSTTAGLADYYGSISGHTEFITKEELLFIQAEATLRATGNIPTAQAFYQSAITANMNKLGVASGDIATYLAANGTLPTTGVNDAIAQVAFQEYIALYLNPEAWTLWRRTGSPDLTPVTGSNGIPRRLLYPNTELQLNAANVPAGATLFAPKIFWDN